MCIFIALLPTSSSPRACFMDIHEEVGPTSYDLQQPYCLLDSARIRDLPLHHTIIGQRRFPSSLPPTTRNRSPRLLTKLIQASLPLFSALRNPRSKHRRGSCNGSPAAVCRPPRSGVWCGWTLPESMPRSQSVSPPSRLLMFLRCQLPSLARYVACGCYGTRHRDAVLSAFRPHWDS